MKKMKFSNLKILTLLIFLFLNVNGNMITNPETISNVSGLNLSIYGDLIRYKAKINLVNEINNFIDSIAPENKLTPLLIVDVCKTYNLDIIFVLSQALLESHYGTKGKAKETNSIFNVGTFDDGQILYRYEHPDNSIEPYAKLLVNRYLNDKPLSKLIKDKGFVNDKGYRFASSRIYEASLRILMIKIDMHTDINMYQSISNMDNKSIYAFFGPSNPINFCNELYALK